MKYRAIPLLLLLLLGAPRLDAQEPVRATAAADSSRALIGAWIGATLHVEAEKGVKLTLPEGRDDIRGAEIVSSEPEQRSTQKGRTVVTKKYTIACFDTGRVQTVLSVRYKKPGDTTTYRAETAPLAFTISGIPVDTSQAFRDIKDVLDVPLTFWEIALYVLLMLCVAALLWYLWRRYSRRPEPEPQSPNSFVKGIDDDFVWVEPLTEREVQVLALLAQGYSNKTIARKLVLTEGTVKTHAHNIYAKLAVSTRGEAVARARTLGILA